MAAFLQKTLCRAVWYSDWKSTAGANVPVASRGVLGVFPQPPTERETETENTDSGWGSR